MALSAIEIPDYGFDIFGLVKNSGPDPLRSASLTLTFLDDAGEVIAREYASITVTILPPGEHAPFRVTISDVRQFDASRVQTEPSWRIAGPDHRWSRDVMRVVNSSGRHEFGTYYVSGELRNDSSSRVTSVYVHTILFTDDGRFIAGNSLNFEGLDLAPGAVMPFETLVPIQGASEDVANFEISADARLEQ